VEWQAHPYYLEAMEAARVFREKSGEIQFADAVEAVAKIVEGIDFDATGDRRVRSTPEFDRARALFVDIRDRYFVDSPQVKAIARFLVAVSEAPVPEDFISPETAIAATHPLNERLHEPEDARDRERRLEWDRKWEAFVCDRPYIPGSEDYAEAFDLYI